MTDCCGSEYIDDAATCPDCGHVCCDDCQVKASHGRCWCKYSTRGSAIFDQGTESGRDFIRGSFGYRGPFKALMQVRMETELMRPVSFRRRDKSMKARVPECGYFLCNAPPSGWSRENPACRTKLTDDNIDQFVVCEKCRSIAYCSEACRDADACTPTIDFWETGDDRTHAERCEPYKDNNEFPYVSVALRKYKKEFGRYPHPLGGATPGGETNGTASAAAEGEKGAEKKTKKQKLV